jgi:hypothetical protein
MNLTELRILADNMKLNESKDICHYNDFTLTINKSKKVGKDLKREYDESKDIKIWLRAPYKKKPFMPSHERILLDLFIKRIQDQKKISRIHEIIEAIFNNEDLDGFKDELTSIKFDKEIDPIYINLAYLQAYMIEQEINFEGKGKYPDKPRLYIMGYIRQSILGDYGSMVNVIKRMRLNPPADKFTIKWDEKKQEIILSDKKLNKYVN